MGKVEILLKRGRRQAYHRKFEECKADFETKPDFREHFRANHLPIISKEPEKKIDLPTVQCGECKETFFSIFFGFNSLELPFGQPEKNAKRGEYISHSY